MEKKEHQLENKMVLGKGVMMENWMVYRLVHEKVQTKAALSGHLMARMMGRETVCQLVY